jgi:glycosyltransferase involved in cell wall biosynthesis
MSQRADAPSHAAPARVLYVESNADGTIGGSYYSLLYLIQGLDRRRYTATVVFQNDHLLMDDFRAAGAETLIWPLPRPRTFGHGGGRLAPLRLAAQKAANLLHGFVWQAVRRAWFLRRRNVALVHLNNTVLRSHEWMFAARLARVPCLTHERGINGHYPRAAKKLGARLGAIICISDAVRQTLRNAGADFGNLVTIHNALDPAAMAVTRTRAEMRAAVGLSDGAPVIGMVGNIREWKGQETLVLALDRVRREIPDARVVFIGDTAAADRDYHRQVEDTIARLGLGGHIVFSGYQRHVADWVGMVDVVVHASVLPEPFGRVILEAMALRKPVIGAAAGAIPEIVEEGRTGLTFPPGDHERLAAALVAVLRDPATARAMGEQGYARLTSAFDIRHNVSQTQDIYERLLRAAH